MHDSGMQARSEIRRLLSDHDHRPRKSYGQNFIADPGVVARIVEVAGIDRTTDVVEIGAGTGALTVALAAVAHRVVAYEVDHALEAILDEVVGSHGNVEVRYADVTRVRLGSALDGEPWTMVSNLPYNVGTGIVLDTLRMASNVDRLVVMVQREVAERLTAAPGTKTYGIPSVIVGLHGRAHISFTVPPHMFEPTPRVDSAVVVIDRIPAPQYAAEAIGLATTAFGQRRKMLRRSLANTVPDEGVFTEAGIDPEARPESLGPDRFVGLATAMAAR
jgi:16S rRNA (adenine1518-N6/adenine1519-N6)-dimethyltransferase